MGATRYSGAAGPRFAFLINRLLPAVFIAVCALFYLGPIVEGDFFWHLRAGQSIALEGIPSHIPIPTEWAGQWLLYEIWRMGGGAAGIVLLRAASYVSLLWLLYAWMRRSGAGRYASLFLLFFPAALFMSFPNERPQIFTFLFFPLTVLLLERHRVAGGLWPPVILALMLMAWANVHAGFMLGYAAVGVYFAVSAWRALSSRVSPARVVSLGVVLSLPVLLMLIYGADIAGLMRQIWAQVFSPSGYSESLQENLPPLVAARAMGEYYPAYWGSLLMVALGLWHGIRRRSMPVEHALLLIIFCALSLRSLRFMPYPAMLLPLAAGQVSDALQIDGRRLPRFIGPAFIASVMAAWFVLAPPRILLDASPEFPRGATEFLGSAQTGGTVFSYHGWTGYLYWMLPEKRQLMRVEGITEAMDEAYDKILWADETDVMGEPQWRAMLDAYGLRVIVVPAMSPVSGERFPIVDALLQSRQWYLVYSDGVANVYLKDTPENAAVIREYSRPKANAYLQGVEQARRELAEEPHRGAAWTSLEELYLKLGLRNEAANVSRHKLPPPLNRR